jgi:hypothetical protein
MSLPQTMKAIQYTGVGGPEVIVVRPNFLLLK